ncbi:MAG: glycosyltransferase [Saprospiraceae bacterium]|nr:glycosyltransferase [Saprospiraceae bacterium]
MPLPETFLLTAIAIGIAYLVAIGYIRMWWRRLPEWRPPANDNPTVFISVIVPARNEAANIGACLQSLLSQNYPAHLFEIIVVDDHSEDDTARRAGSIPDERVRVVVSPGAQKKQALAYGVSLARGELIAATDADCQAPPQWLSLLASAYENRRPAFIAAPVAFHKENNLLGYFQSLDYLGMMVLTGAGIYSGRLLLANGANLAYPKAVFEEVGGFAGIDHVASGDDMFLLQKIARRYPDRLFFIKNPEATVLTSPQPSLAGLWAQRLRWASKSSAFRGGVMLVYLALVFVVCGGILLGLAPAPFAALILLAFKLIADYALLSEACRYFQRSDLLRYFLPAQLLHIAYIALIGLAGVFVRRYRWKGREVR